MPYTLNLIFLSAGIILAGCIAIAFDKKVYEKLWWVVGGTYILAIITQAATSINEPLTFFRGGIIYDSHTQNMSMWLVLLAAILHFSRAHIEKQKTINHVVLSLAFTFFSVFSVHANRVFFTALGVIGMLIASAGILFDQQGSEEKNIQIQALARKIFFIGLISSIITVAVIYLTGQTQVEEMQMVIARQKEMASQLFALALLAIACSFLIGSNFPLNGLLGNTRDKADWLDIVFCSAAFGFVGLQVFLKYVVTLFYRVTVGGAELESSLNFELLANVRMAITVLLVLIPPLALLQKKIWDGLILLIANCFWVLLFAITFGQKLLMAHVYTTLPSITISLCLLAISFKKLEINHESKLIDWVGRGRKNLIQTLTAVIAVWSLVGLPPFYTSTLIQKTLSVNSVEVGIILWNLLLFGIYALRLTILSFQAPIQLSNLQTHQNHFENTYAKILILLLIFMGIFHQPLYKYGAFSIRHLFGDY